MSKNANIANSTTVNPLANVANLFAGMVPITATVKARGRGASEGDIKPRLSFNPSNNGTQLNKKGQKMFGTGDYSVALNQSAGVLFLNRKGESTRFRFGGLDQVFELMGGTSDQTMKVELVELDATSEDETIKNLIASGFVAYGVIELKVKEVVPGRGKRKAQKADDTVSE